MIASGEKNENVADARRVATRRTIAMSFSARHQVETKPSIRSLNKNNKKIIKKKNGAQRALRNRSKKP